MHTEAFLHVSSLSPNCVSEYRTNSSVPWCVYLSHVIAIGRLDPVLSPKLAHAIACGQLPKLSPCAEAMKSFHLPATADFLKFSPCHIANST
jgi:hypothetical protein